MWYVCVLEIVYARWHHNKTISSPLISCRGRRLDLTSLQHSVHVFVTCKPGTEEEFQTASLANARASSLEPGIARFDVIQQIDDPCKFVLVEVYKNEDAPAAHKETQHYLDWRDEVADMMAEPRSAIKFRNLFPVNGAGWDYGVGVDLE